MNEKQANFTIGEYAFNTFWSQYLGSSIPYHFTTYIFAIAKDRSYTSIEQFIFSFRDEVWFCTMGTLLLFLLVKLIIRLISWNERLLVGKQNDELLFNAFSVYLGNSLNNFPTQTFARTILTIWMIGCIVLRNSYQGALFELFCSPIRIPSPTTVDELIENNYQVLIRKGSTHYILQDNPELNSL